MISLTSAMLLVPLLLLTNFDQLVTKQLYYLKVIYLLLYYLKVISASFSSL